MAPCSQPYRTILLALIVAAPRCRPSPTTSRNSPPRSSARKCSTGWRCARLKSSGRDETAAEVAPVPGGLAGSHRAARQASARGDRGRRVLCRSTMTEIDTALVGAHDRDRYRQPRRRARRARADRREAREAARPRGAAVAQTKNGGPSAAASVRHRRSLTRKCRRRCCYTSRPTPGSSACGCRPARRACETNVDDALMIPSCAS